MSIPKHVMIDLETMGQGCDAAVVAIGAVRFGKAGITETFYKKIDLEDAALFGGLDPSTVVWWLKQSDAARAELTGGDGLHPPEAARLCAEFIRRSGGDVQIWGNGSEFDNVILKNFMIATEVRVPWEFWNNRCYRTIKHMYPHIKATAHGTKHNALDDAIAQAEHLLEIAKQTEIKL